MPLTRGVAYDPRISAVYLQIDNLNCGWAKADEIRRQILNFRKSEIYAPPSAYVHLFGFTVQGTFVRGVYDYLGIEPQVERIGKYKSGGDRLTRKTMSEDHREMLTALLDNIYSNWLDKIVPFLKYRKYSGVRKETVGISSGKEQIAVIRASGTISRVGGKGIIAEEFINNIHRVKASNKFKAAVIRIDSPGGDALASDLMWREIRLLAAKKPIIASMSDVAASGGYYMAMGEEGCAWIII
ncbi:putative peptidase S49, ClpP/crotonase-like domain-containing protein [Medicago truncatula]|uniref:Putative peptidase S49, ClpP/crotonase-like domain-containing protein n=1 Tax=Medicago truncatula TaxID=3880 RepID=A0A396IGJ5_MEDTR|nr:putative peptidase S49, ClpP/crotonase-like domain-containing protein [Medicago truncatula]